jgi:hypothetical protein
MEPPEESLPCQASPRQAMPALLYRQTVNRNADRLEATSIRESEPRAAFALVKFKLRRRLGL